MSYELGFAEGIRTAIGILRTREYGRALKALERILEKSQSRPSEILQVQEGHDTSTEVI
jgi:hypothetical protein